MQHTFTGLQATKYLEKTSISYTWFSYTQKSPLL